MFSLREYQKFSLTYLGRNSRKYKSSGFKWPRRRIVVQRILIDNAGLQVWCLSLVIGEVVWMFRLYQPFLKRIETFERNVASERHAKPSALNTPECSLLKQKEGRWQCLGIATKAWTNIPRSSFQQESMGKSVAILLLLFCIFVCLKHCTITCSQNGHYSSSILAQSFFGLVGSCLRVHGLSSLAWETRDIWVSGSRIRNGLNRLNAVQHDRGTLCLEPFCSFVTQEARIPSMEASSSSLAIYSRSIFVQLRIRLTSSSRF